MDFKFKNEMKIRCLSILLISILAFTMPSCHIIDALDGDKDTDLGPITLSAYGAFVGYDAPRVEAYLHGNSRGFPETIDITFSNPSSVHTMTKSCELSDSTWRYDYYNDYNSLNLSTGTSYTVTAIVSGKTISCSGMLNGRWVRSTL